MYTWPKDVSECNVISKSVQNIIQNSEQNCILCDPAIKQNVNVPGDKVLCAFYYHKNHFDILHS